MRIDKILRRCAVVAVAGAVWTSGIVSSRLGAQSKRKTEPACCGSKKRSGASKKATVKLDARVQALLRTTPTNKVNWEMLVRDAESGKKMCAHYAEKRLWTASHM